MQIGSIKEIYREKEDRISPFEEAKVAAVKPIGTILERADF